MDITTEYLKPIEDFLRIRTTPCTYLPSTTTISQTGQHHSRCGMEGGGRQSRLLGRLLGKLRGEHRLSPLDKHCSFNSTSMSESIGQDSTTNDEDLDTPTLGAPSADTCDDEDEAFGPRIDLRYGGQYLTPEQLPQFCDQLQHLVGVVRNIQSYAKVTGEYPAELERRLESEAREVASLAAEARNARDVVCRARAQRRAVRANKRHLLAHLASMRETEVRELESTVRLSDRKLYKTWEALKDSSDPVAFNPLLDEIRNKQTALDCLMRLVDSRRSALARTAPPPQPLPPPETRENIDESPVTAGAPCRRRAEAGARRCSKRRRKEPRSVPLSEEPSTHGPTPQVTLYIQGAESTSRYRVGSAGAVALTPLQLCSGGSVRDILFFTTNQ